MRHPVLLSDLITAVIMLVIGATYLANIWLGFTNIPMVITCKLRTISRAAL